MRSFGNDMEAAWIQMQPSSPQFGRRTACFFFSRPFGIQPNSNLWYNIECNRTFCCAALFSQAGCKSGCSKIPSSLWTSLLCTPLQSKHKQCASYNIEQACEFNELGPIVGIISFADVNSYQTLKVNIACRQAIECFSS